MATSFAQATAVTRIADGLFTARLDPDWKGLTAPHGGVLMVHALRAMQEFAGEDVTLRSATALFPSVARRDDVEIEVTPIRTGRAVSHLRAAIRESGDKEVRLDVVGVLGRAREHPTSYGDNALPDVPPVDDSLPEQTPWGNRSGQSPEAIPDVVPPIFARLERRRAGGSVPWDIDPDTSAGATDAYPIRRWTRLAGSADPLDPLAYVVIADLPGPAVWARSGGENFVPLASLELSLRILAPASGPWVLAEYRSAWAGHGYTTTDSILRDQDGRILATCNQLMYLRRPLPLEELTRVDPEL